MATMVRILDGPEAVVIRIMKARQKKTPHIKITKQDVVNDILMQAEKWEVKK